MDKFDHEHTEGDKGANAFPLPNHREVKELHALWDKILWAGYPDESRPFTDEAFAAFQTKTEELMSRNARHKPSRLYQIGDENSWASDSYTTAKTLYDGVTENEEVPQSYLDKGIPIAEAQIMKGGYRLAFVLDHIFSSSLNSSDDFLAKEISNILVTFFQ